MKKFIIFICLFGLSAPAFADLINPDLTSKQIEELRMKKAKLYQERTRKTQIRNICGDLKNLDKKECKAKLKKEYDETIKVMQDIIKENKNIAADEISDSVK